MAQQSGQTFLHYRLIEKIGEGGMGVVWKAKDTTLDRDVAIKFLPEAFAADSDRMARFEREAKILASLNHPNIAAVYGFHEVDGLRFIVMELVDGETLADRLHRSGISRFQVGERLQICSQIAQALEAAHDSGIVHRDLKPANIKIKRDGSVKVLDFGLARTVVPDSAADGGPDAPTVVAGHTEAGIILGTPQYMSPEQARGIAVDKRTDIWSLGCILYECLAGRRPFDGQTPTDTIAQVVSKEPDFASLPGGTPNRIKHLLHRCLDKDTKRRLRDAGEIRIAIDELQSSPSSETVDRSSAPSKRIFSAALIPWVLVVILGLALVYFFGQRASITTGPGLVSRWSVPLPAGTRLGYPLPGGWFDYAGLVAISADGARVAYAVQDQRRQVELYVRELGAVRGWPISGTTNARAPFFSPDGQWLGFLANDMVQKVALGGGSPQKICDVGRVVSFDACWSPDGESIVYATDDGLWLVPAAGGSGEPLTTPDADRGEVGHHSPRFTSDGRSIFFTVSVTPETHLALLSLKTRTWDIIVQNASQGVSVTNGYLVFARAGELLASPYDASEQRVDGSAVSVLQGVHTTPGIGGVILTHFDISETGTLVYAPASSAGTVDQLLWVDKAGNETVVTSGPGTWVHPRLSPDGERISMDIHSADGMRDIYIYEIQRGQLNRLTETGTTWESEWRPDGRRIAIMSGAPAGQWSLFWLPSDFSGSPELFYRSSHAVPANWLPDGKSLLFHELVEGGIWRISPGVDTEPEVVMHTAANERFPSLTPDGKWMAYVADESGRREVFVRSFPDPGARYRVSIDGGGEPVWSPDGRQLFFRQRDQMFSVSVSYQPVFSVGRPEALFRGRYDAAAVSGHQHYDISPDGKRFLMIKHGKPVGPGEVRVVLGWSQELGVRKN